MSDIQKTPLKNHIDFLTGFPFKSEGYTDNLTDIKLLCGDNIAQGRLRWDTVKRWPRVDKEKYGRYLLKEGDVVLAMDRPWIDAGLKFASVAPDDLPSLLLQRTARLRGSETLDIYYLRYIIGSPWFTKYVKNINTGSLVPHISGDQIKNFSFPVPPINHQRKVSAVLTAIDKKIELNNLINAELEAMAKLTYDYWFVQFDFPDANGKPYKSSGGKMVYNETLKREIPDGWEESELGDLITFERGISYKSREITDDGIPMINLNSFDLSGRYKNKGIKFYSGKYADKKVVSAGDLVIAITDVTRNAEIIGKAFCIPDLFDDDVLISCDVAKVISTGKLNSEFLEQLFNSDYYHSYIKHFASGTLVLHLNLDGVNWCKIPLPPKSLVDKYGAIRKEVNRKITLSIRENERLSNLRDWLLPMLMNGQVTVNDESS